MNAEGEVGIEVVVIVLLVCRAVREVPDDGHVLLVPLVVVGHLNLGRSRGFGVVVRAAGVTHETGDDVRRGLCMQDERAAARCGEGAEYRVLAQRVCCAGTDGLVLGRLDAHVGIGRRKARDSHRRLNDVSRRLDGD